MNTIAGTNMDVGVRELRDSLSRHLADVQEGRSITVTDHGRPIARLVPYETPSPYERLVAEGRITPAQDRSSYTPHPIRIDGTIEDLLGDHSS